MSTPVRWGDTGAQTEPPEAKKDLGASAGDPEGAQFFNWAMARIAAGANLDRSDDVLFYLPLYNSLVMERGTGVLTFSRAGVGGYIDQYGFRREAVIDEPRFEDGLLLEQSSTNQLLHPDDLSNGAWTKTESSILSGTQTGSDGVANSADELIESGNTAEHLIRQDFDTPPADNARASLYFDCKADTRTWVGLLILKKSGAGVRAWFDLANGVVGSVDAGATSRMVRMANGFWRCFIEDVDVLSGGSAVQGRAFLATGDSNISYAGDSSSGIIISIGQGENLSLSTGYIANVASALTRAVEHCYLTHRPNFPNWVTGGFSISFDVFLNGFIAANREMMSWSEGHGGNYKVLLRSDGLELIAQNSEVFKDFPSNPQATFNVWNKFLIRYDGGEPTGRIDLEINGINVGSSTGNDPSADQTRTFINIGQLLSGGGATLNGKIKNIRLIARRLTDLESSIIT